MAMRSEVELDMGRKMGCTSPATLFSAISEKGRRLYTLFFFFPMTVLWRMKHWWYYLHIVPLLHIALTHKDLRG